jgi:asparagine synthase (glutamine-hydrolysing)
MNHILGGLALGGSRLPDRLCQSIPGGAARADAIASGPLAKSAGALMVALKGRPRVGAEPFDAAKAADRILTLYAAEGPKMLERLRGPFALAIVDSARQTVLLAIDRIGIESLSYSAEGESLVFGGNATDVARARAARPTLNHQALFDFMLGHMIASPDSVYTNVRKLEHGTCLEWRSGTATVRRYWQPDFRRSGRDTAALAADVLPVMGRAIERCDPEPATGTFLSGGLDSSTVTGVFTRSRNGDATAFSVAFGVDEFNELRFAKMASERFGCKHVVYEVVPDDIVDSIPKIAAAYDEPFGNSSAVPTFCCARTAKSHGIEHLLAGDGGDEIFGGNSRYVRQRVFEIYARVPRLVRAALLEPLAARLDPERAPLPLRKFSSYVRQAKVPLPERFESWNMIYREGAERVFDRDFVASVDTGAALKAMRATWESCPSNDLLDRMLWYDWKYTLADNDLRKVSRACDLAGVRVSYPMLDEELIELSIDVPSDAKIANNELRTFFKGAVRGFLPDDIISKEKHGFGLPFGVWLKTHAPLQEVVYGNLAALRRRKILSVDFIDRVASEHRSGHAGYYGYAIWDMVMLEEWLAQQERG